MNKSIIIVASSSRVLEPKDCPICDKAFSDIKDIINFRVHGCCEACDIKYRYPNREKWKEGWRPNN
jgi:hydrogenase maturation factor HypF (carbamoyltransferase family)